MRTRRVLSRAILTGAATTAVVILGCDDTPTHPADPVYDPQIPTAWASTVNNAFFPLVPGTTFEYAEQTSHGLETITVEVLAGTKVVYGVVATIVRDRVYQAGELIEDTHDWYAQDAAGNVWYLGEDSKTIENGVVVSTEGSWEWGVDGALPGIIMRSDPAAHIGVGYRQEFYRGHAEDWAKVVAVGQSVSVPYGNFTGCLQIEEWSGLATSAREYKYYGSQLGQVLELPVSGGARSELVRVTRP